MRNLLVGLALSSIAVIAGCGQSEPSGDTPVAPSDTPTPVGDPTPPIVEEQAKAPAIPRLVDVMPPSISKIRPPATPDPSIKADYNTLAQVKVAHDKAIGKSIVFRGYTSLLAPPGQPINIFECDYEGDRIIFEGIFDAHQIGLVRALPSTNVGVKQCPLIHLQIDEFSRPFDRPRGKILGIYELEQDPQPEKLPVGVDFISMDDALIAGPAAVGKVADVAVYRANSDEYGGIKSYTLYTTHCGAHGGWNASFYVAANDQNSALLESIPRGDLEPQGCQRLRFKITKAPSPAFSNRFGAEIIGVGDTFPKPFPHFNP